MINDTIHNDCHCNNNDGKQLLLHVEIKSTPTNHKKRSGKGLHRFVGVIALSVLIVSLGIRTEESKLHIFHQSICRSEETAMAINNTPAKTQNVTANQYYYSSSTAKIEAPHIQQKVNKQMQQISSTSELNPNKEYELCFVTSVFSNWVVNADKLQNVTAFASENPSFAFFAVTNLPNLPTPGWTHKILLRNLPFRRYITQSRLPKFMAWNKSSNLTSKMNIIPDSCAVVFYVDSIGEIVGTADQFRAMAHDILNSTVQIAQYRHPGYGGALKEFRRIARAKKDTPENIQKSINWLQSQSDFSDKCKLYENRYIGYNPQSISWQQATSFFWDHYSLEEDSWRDQPLWCYVLDKFHITPVKLRHEELFELNLRRMTTKHKYKQEQGPVLQK